MPLLAVLKSEVKQIGLAGLRNKGACLMTVSFKHKKAGSKTSGF